MKKKITSLILSSLSVMVSPLCNTTFATKKFTKIEKKEKTTNRYRTNKNNVREKNINNLIKVFLLSFSTSIPTLYLSLKGAETLDYNISKKNLINYTKKYFGAVPAKYMQKKAGIHWCWLSCIRALYKFHNFDISDEELYTKLTNRSPEFFIVDRLSGASLEEEFNMHFSSVTTKIKPVFAIICVKRSEGVKKILENIKKFYNYIGKIPFYILDSDTKAKGGGHAVVITDILKNSFVIEEPDTQLQYERDSYDYCANFFQGAEDISRDKIEFNLVALVKSDNPVKSLVIDNEDVGEMLEPNKWRSLDSENLERWNAT